MHGKLFFIGTIVFVFGILYGIFFSISWAYFALSIFFGILCFTGSIFCIPGQRTQSFVLACGILCIVFPVGEVRSVLASNALPSAYTSLINTPISLMGTVIADPDIRQKNQQLLLKVTRNGERTNILVFAPLFQHFAYGEKVLVAGTLTKPQLFATQSGRTFRYDQFLAKKGVFSLVMQADVLEVAPPAGLWDTSANFFFEIKHTFVEGLTRALPDPYAELATGLLTGDQHGLGDTLVDTLALSGLIWVVVLSGYHVTLIAGAILKVVSFFPQRIAFGIAVAGVLAVIFATGASAPSLRGGLMACLTLFARSTGRAYDALRALCAAAILILLWNPLLLAYDSGFQLSLVVTPALILGVPILEMWLLRVAHITNSFIREVIAVSIVAQLACLPLILWQTGQLGLWAIPANVFVMSFVPTAMLFSVIAGFVGVILPLLAPLAGLPAYAVLYYVLTVAKISVSLPYASVILPPFPFVGTICLYGFFIVLLLALRLPRSKNAFQ